MLVRYRPSQTSVSAEFGDAIPASFPALQMAALSRMLHCLLCQERDYKEVGKVLVLGSTDASLQALHITPLFLTRIYLCDPPR